MIPFPDPKRCPRTPGHKLYYKARRRFCKMKKPKSRGEIFTRRPMIFQKDALDAEIGPTRAKISICNFCPAVLYYLILNPFRRCAIVAQLDRAFGSDPEGQRFESSRSHKIPSTLSCAGDFYLRPGGFEQHGPAADLPFPIFLPDAVQAIGDEGLAVENVRVAGFADGAGQIAGGVEFELRAEFGAEALSQSVQ